MLGAFSSKASCGLAEAAPIRNEAASFWNFVEGRFILETALPARDCSSNLLQWKPEGWTVKAAYALPV